jgi:hypothetical protein
MKNTLAENMLRFGVKNLSELDVKKIEEQITGTSITNNKKLIQSFIQQGNTLPDNSVITYNGPDYFAFGFTGERDVQVFIYQMVDVTLNGGGSGQGQILLPYIIPYEIAQGYINYMSKTWENFGMIEPVGPSITTHNLKGRKGIDSVIGYINDVYNELDIAGRTINIPPSLKAWENFITVNLQNFSNKFVEISKNPYWKLIQPKLVNYSKIVSDKIPVK